MTQLVTAQQTGAITIQQPPSQGNPAGYLNVPQGSTVFCYDSFSTQNRFYGAQIGGRFGWDFERLSID